MSILYRAVWSDPNVSDRTAIVGRFQELVAAWTQERDDAPPLVEGVSEFEVSQGRHRTVVLRSVSGNAFEVVATDQVPADPTEWVTTVRILPDDAGIHTLVELSMSSDDLARRVAVGRPKIVHDLLEAAGKPQLGGSGILTEPLALPANGVSILTDMLANPERSLPIVVCAEPRGEHDSSWLRVARGIAARAEGVAAVVTLDAQAAGVFKQEFGQLAIWDGGVRVYSPGVVTKESEGWRHRYYLRTRLEASETATVNRIVYSVAQLSTRRRIPGMFKVFGEQNGLPAEALGGMVPAETLASARDEWEYALELARDEQSALERELSAATGHLARLKNELITRGMVDLLWGTQHETTDSMPDEVQVISEAVLAAQVYLTRWLSLPDSAIRELDDLDTAPEAFNWGNKTWRGLRALAGYAEDRAGGWNKGGFWEWCASGPLLGWPATSKKLSMTESEGVQTGGKFKGTRDFAVDPQVAPSGVVTMLAHLKISEGGGNLAPRVYFFDDTGGSTKKIHIGLVGPHYLVPNKSSN
ncbi:hypothetical protein [Micrococcus terreus]|uniref:Uncharacterized protein n=1 Tax=Micrococcus terreus TaxID=574650 RepID=A0A1I7MRM8_9MICC|nr:hypothetical protein [Micrococcus terreus]SFV24595.1 hypothetical protein SAMN04487966_1121 [Micrococcus terreus]